MNKNLFLRCFPLGNNKMACQHLNGRWIIFNCSADNKKISPEIKENEGEDSLLAEQKEE
jgi:hypothetical protein